MKFFPLVLLILLAGCANDTQFRRSVESIDFKGGVDASRVSVGGRINFRDPDLKSSFAK